MPGLVDGAEAVVTVRSKDKGGRLVTWTAKVVELAPGSPGWEAAVAELKGKRLNAPDGEAMPERWARECRVLRLEPTGATAPLPDASLAAAPVRTPATTREPIPAGLPRPPPEETQAPLAASADTGRRSLTSKRHLPGHWPRGRRLSTTRTTRPSASAPPAPPTPSASAPPAPPAPPVPSATRNAADAYDDGSCLP